MKKYYGMYIVIDDEKEYFKDLIYFDNKNKYKLNHLKLHLDITLSINFMARYPVIKAAITPKNVAKRLIFE